MVSWTKPNHRQRLVVAFVMPVRVRLSADEARLPFQFTASDGIAHDLVRFDCLRVSFAPFFIGARKRAVLLPDLASQSLAGQTAVMPPVRLSAVMGESCQRFKKLAK